MALTICTHCGAHTPERVSRGPLTVQIDPPLATWRGQAFRVSRVQCAALRILAVKGAATRLALRRAIAGYHGSDKTTNTQISMLRERLPHGLRIEPIPRWGYKLEIDDDQG